MDAREVAAKGRIEVGDLIKWVHRGTLSIHVHIGVVIFAETPSLKIRWEDGKESWMNAAWLEKL